MSEVAFGWYKDQAHLCEEIAKREMLVHENKIYGLHFGPWSPEFEFSHRVVCSHFVAAVWEQLSELWGS